MQTMMPQPSSETIATALRVRFTAEVPDGAGVFCRFADPRAMVAVGESVAVDVLSNNTDSADGIDIITTGEAKLSAQKLQAWLGTDSACALMIKTDDLTLQWRPGRAVLQASAADCKMPVPAVIEFAFYEGELRKLEKAVEPFEAAAAADVSHAYEMTAEHRPHWDRLYRTMEKLYRLRLQFARLEPHLHRPNSQLTAEGRRVFTRLATKAQVADRLEAISDRLETVEDLYEGAVDRVTDYKAYRKGSFLEIAIVILLAVETALLLLQGHLPR